MKILHTADWHVGRTLRGQSRAEEHKAVLDEIVSIAADRDVDLVLVAGDLFDMAAPSPESERIVYSTLLSLANTGAAVVVIAGNHDNPHRLSAVRPILEKGCGVHVSSFPAPPNEGGVVTLEAKTGEIAQVACLPFLSQRNIIKADELMDRDPSEHGSEYSARVRAIVASLTSELNPDAVRILMTHLTVLGAAVAGSERQAHTGFDYAVPTTAFPEDLHYVALGHFHRAQTLPASCPVRYCGSPMQLDFGESGQEKMVLLVEAIANEPATVEGIPLTQGRQLATLQGNLEQLEGLASQPTGDFLRIIVEETPRLGLADEVRELFPRAVDIRIADASSADSDTADDPLFLERSPVELFSEYLKERAALDDDIVDYFKELLDSEHDGASA